MAYSQTYDVAIIGGGIAGLSVALRLPETMHIAIFTKGQLGESNTRYAQGGLAAALGPGDSPELHFLDTIAAGAGHCDEQAVHILVEQAPAAVAWLIEMGVQFDKTEPGSYSHATHDGLLLGREAAHSRWRVLHAGGDATGAEIERALVNALRKRPSIELYEETVVSDLLVSDGVCCGVEAIDRDGNTYTIGARTTILANGGAGGLWLHTSNPSGATADGLALAWRAGAALTDLEFMQFHPTVLVMDGSSHLISEAVRGEGAYLRNHAGERFMPRYHPLAELAPRDVVARAILSEMLAEQTEYQYLDLCHLPSERMHSRFPTISSICRDHGLNLAKDLLPVAPAAHYCMGGVMTDTEGRTTLLGLYAVGEVACTGVHGANRLASNSLLEGLVFGLRLADTLLASTKQKIRYPNDGTMPTRARWGGYATSCSSEGGGVGMGGPLWSPGSVNCHEESALVGVRPDDAQMPSVDILQQLRQIMWRYVSLTRNEQGLLIAKNKLNSLQHLMAGGVPVGAGDVGLRGRDPCGTLSRGKVSLRLLELEISNMLQVAELVVAAALQRRESRGSHWRSDYDTPDEKLAACQYVFQRARTDLDRSATNTFLEETMSHV